MIVSVRGPCGSGKSTAVREIVSRCESTLRNQRVGRRVAWSLICTLGDDRGRVWIPGHYDVACGGLDTVRLRHLDAIYQDAAEAAGLGLHVLMEGAATYDHWTRLRNLTVHGETRILWLDTSAEQCLAGLRAKKPNLSPRRQTELMRVGKITKDVDRLRNVGVPVCVVSREGAADVIWEWLGCA